MSQLILNQMTTAPSAPSTGKVSVYVDGNGDLAWKDAAGNVTKIAAAGSYTLTLTGSGTLNLGSNTVTAPTSGNLAIYATSTWTPVLKFGATTVTGVTINSATYVTIGNMCFVQAQITLTGKNGTGNVSIEGLPVASNASGAWPINVGYHFSLTSSVSSLHGYVGAGGSIIYLVKSTGGTGVAVVTDADLSTTTTLILAAHYRT